MPCRFFGVGAYATAILTEKAGCALSRCRCSPARLFTTAIGALVAVPALRLKNIYLAIATLGFGVVLQKIIFEWRGLTGGGGGLALTAPNIAGYELGATRAILPDLRADDARPVRRVEYQPRPHRAARCW